MGKFYDIFPKKISEIQIGTWKDKITNYHDTFGKCGTAVFGVIQRGSSEN